MTGAGGKKGIEWMTPHIQRRLKEREMWRGAKVAVDAPEARGVEQDAG